MEGNDASFKYEDVYVRGYETVPELERGLRGCFRFYNEVRLHQSLGYRTPAWAHGSVEEAKPATSS